MDAGEKRGEPPSGGERRDDTMAGHRIQRTTEDIRRELTDIMRGLKDPRVQGMLSIVRVEVTNDLSYAKVYVSSMDGIEQAKIAVQGLKSAAGYARRELGGRLHIRHVPELVFIATDSIEYSAEINKMLEELKEEHEGEHED